MFLGQKKLFYSRKIRQPKIIAQIKGQGLNIQNEIEVGGPNKLASQRIIEGPRGSHASYSRKTDEFSVFTNKMC